MSKYFSSSILKHVYGKFEKNCGGNLAKNISALKWEKPEEPMVEHEQQKVSNQLCACHTFNLKISIISRSVTNLKLTSYH